MDTHLRQRRHLVSLLSLGTLILAGATPPAVAVPFDLGTATIADINAAFDAGALSSERLVELYLARIDAYDKRGPRLNAVFFLNDQAIEEARALDAERRQSGPRSPIHGVPIVVKDLVDAKGLPTTAGFRPFGEPLPERDSTVVARIREAGGIILAKVATTNWFGNGFDETHFHGPTLNAYNTEYLPGSSSNGPGAAMAAWYAAAAIGTDTGGSVLIPSAHSGVVGMVATQGLVSRAGIMPRGATQDRAGPMGRSVHDIAIMLSVIAGWDAEDLVTFEGVGRFPQADWADQVARAKLHGMRIGVLREMIHDEQAGEEGRKLFEQALEDLRSGGAQVIDPVLTGLDLKELSTAAMGRTAEYEKLHVQNAYLARFGPNAPFATIQSMIDHLGEDQFSPAMIASLRLEAPDRSADYQARLRLRENIRRVIAEAMERHDLDALVFPFSLLPPGRVGETRRARGATNSLASNNGLPSVVVPAGYLPGDLPMGLQFIGKPHSDLNVMKAAHAFEQQSRKRIPAATVPGLPDEQFTYEHLHRIR